MYDGAVVAYSDVENEASEPLATVLEDTIVGGQVIRTFGQRAAVLARAGRSLERLGAANMGNFALGRWQGARLEFVAAAMLLITALFCVSQVCEGGEMGGGAGTAPPPHPGLLPLRLPSHRRSGASPLRSPAWPSQTRSASARS